MKKEKCMWINARERLPEKNGTYMMQTVFGEVSTILYTVKGCWNSYYSDGLLHDENSWKNDGYIVRWFDVPKPDPVPTEWYKEYEERKHEG